MEADNAEIVWNLEAKILAGVEAENYPQAVIEGDHAGGAGIGIQDLIGGTVDFALLALCRELRHRLGIDPRCLQGIINAEALPVVHHEIEAAQDRNLAMAEIEEIGRHLACGFPFAHQDIGTGKIGFTQDEIRDVAITDDLKIAGRDFLRQDDDAAQGAGHFGAPFLRWRGDDQQAGTERSQDGLDTAT